AQVQMNRSERPECNERFDYAIDPGSKVADDEIRIHGNERLSARRINRKMKTDEDGWWRFWSSAKFERKTYEEDLQRVIDYYNERGYFDARIVHDTVYVQDGDDPGVVIEFTVDEGNR